MITTVTLNPAIDKTITVEKFIYGSVNRVDSVREDMGGKGINVARVLKSLGGETIAAGFIGKGNIDYIQSLMKSEALKSDFIIVDGQTRTNSKIVETSTHTTTDINEPGFFVTENNIKELSDNLQRYAQISNFVAFSGSIPKGASPKLYQELIRPISGLTKIVLDAEGPALLEGLKAQPYIIKPNLFELETALNVKLDSPEKIVKTARELISIYNIHFILLSMGGEGSILISADEAFYAPALKVKVKGTVGAGDSMLAGFLYGLMLGEHTEKALAYATACGALAVSKEGTQSFSKADVQQLYSQVKVEKL